MKRNYYVYALKDPRQKPAKIFYVGKGTGSRSIEHINNLIILVKENISKKY